MSKSDVSLVWKKLYPILTGTNANITEYVIEEILDLGKNTLTENLLKLKPYTKDSFRSWKSQPGLKEIVLDDEMCNFIHLLSRELDLDVNVAWTVVCNFLMFEYYGRVEELQSILRYDSNVRQLIETIWFFYSADRMFLLKTFRHIFEKVYDKDYIFHEYFKTFLKSIDSNLMWENLAKVMENLINEIDRDKSAMVPKDTLTRWIHRNNREQVEVVLLLIHSLQYCEINGTELETILSIFTRNVFARQSFYQQVVSISRPKDLLEIRTAEIGCALAVMEKYWLNPGKCKLLSESIQKKLLLEMKGDTSVILFAWVLLKATVEDTNESKEFCNSTINELIGNKVFVSLYKVITNTLFLNCECGEIVVQAVYQLMIQYVKTCEDFHFLHVQEGVCDLICELLKRKGVVVFDHFMPIFQISMESFPFVFNPFLQMCKCLLSMPDKYDSIMELLKNVPGFLAEIPWDDRRDSCRLAAEQNLFIDSDLFIVPEGTVIERYPYQNYEFTRFIYPFNFYLLMEQFTKSLSAITFEIGPQWHYYDNLKKLVWMGFDFIDHILKHYKGNFRADRELRTLIQRLEIIPTQFCDGPAKNFDFIRLYFRINYTLIHYNLLDFFEAFPPIMRKKFFPQVISFEKIQRQMVLEQVHNGSILFKCLKEEEGMGTHALLVHYLEFLLDIIEKNVYHKEVQVAGMWYMLNIVFPMYQQWRYDDSHEMTKVCKICCSCFVYVLQHYSKSSPDAKEIYKMCINAFMFDKVTMNSYITIFLSDKFYLQSLMEQESNWINGPTLENIRCIRIQLVLLLLLYMYRSQLTNTVCVIDDKVSMMSRAVSTFIVNPYSVSLRILSCRFLEVLARDQNIPLLALLGLDYDQLQRLFLDRLRDPTEDDDVKMHILHLISTCISYQHGMTAAFFNVKRSRKWYSDNKEKTIEGDTVSDFMVDYLMNIKKSHEYLRSPLQVGILHVMSNLWISGKRHLISDVVALDPFWPLLAEPLFRDFNKSPPVYANILKIFSIQLGQKDIDNKFSTTVEKFSENDDQLEKFQKYILNIFKTEHVDEEIIKERQFLLSAWLEFIIMLERRQDLKQIKKNTKFLFIEMCFTGIRSKIVGMHCLEMWLHLCLIHVSTWGLSYNRLTTALLITDFFSYLKLRYPELNSYVRTEVLSMTLVIVKQMKIYYESNKLDLLQFLEQFGVLLDYEYSLLEDQLWKHCRDTELTSNEILLPWVMCTNTVNIILGYENIGEIGVWLSFRNYLSRIMTSINELLGSNRTMPLAKIAFRSLVLYIKSPLHLDFLNINIIKFYHGIEAPITSLLHGRQNKVDLVSLEDGWALCSLLMQFNATYVSKLQYKALPSCYSFVTICEHMLQHIFSIPESTVALKALDLVIHTLQYYKVIFSKWQSEFYKKSNPNYNSIVFGILKLINACLYNILRPKNIVVYTLDIYNKLNQSERIPIGLMVGIMNKLIMTASLGFSIIYYVNPNIIDMMGFSLPDTVYVTVVNDFSVPKFELPISYVLTYGMLLCLSHFLCKTLDAIGVENEPDKIPKVYIEGCIGLVEHQSCDILPNQKLSAFLRYAMYEYSGLADPWIQKLDYKIVKNCLESLMLFLAQQVYITTETMDQDQLPYFKRNLSSELQFFYEFIKKQTLSFFTGNTVSPSFRTDLDLFKRYMLIHRERQTTSDIADNNFCIIISHWFTNFCYIR